MTESTSTPPYPLKTAVLFLVFNRPDTTKQVFEAIRKAKPPQLYIAGDGPRGNINGESEKIQEIRDYVLKNIDWPCDVKTLFRDKNLGCKMAPNSAIDWFFENVEEGIILEDDCLPHPTFFRFCEELLERYRNDERVMSISGNNHQFGRIRTNCSYYFSRYRHTWGWATWRRAWRYSDVNMTLWPEIKDGKWLLDLLGDRKAVRYWTSMFDRVYQGKIMDAWDYQWTFVCWIQNGLAILPNVNLITNIGFGEDSTHTKDENSKFANIKNQPMVFPLSHPPYIIRDSAADGYTEQIRYSGDSLLVRFMGKLSRLCKKTMRLKK